MPSSTQTDTRLRIWRLAARAALVWEAIWAAYWPVAALLAVLASLALLGIPALLPPVLNLALAAVALACLFLLGWRALGHVTLPRTRDAERRLERDSELPHRPFATLRDLPAGGDHQSALWRRHQARAASVVGKLKLRLPDAQLTRHDPLALRAGAILLLASALVIAGPQAGSRLLSALSPGVPAGLAPPPPSIQAWIQPPSYTGLPPVFLPAAGGAVTVPAGSRLTISITGAAARPGISMAGGNLPVETLGQESFQTTAVLAQPGSLRVGGLFSALAEWSIKLLPNEKPVARWSKLPGRAGTSLAVSLPWTVSQRWGVAALEAQLRPKGRDDLPALRVPLPLPGTPKQASGEAKPDLSANPYAGVEMTGRLLARDVSGQHGEGETADFVLPARSFHHPLARAIADLRRRLALHPDQPDEVAGELSALAEAPVTPPVPGLSTVGAMLNMASVAALLTDKPSGEQQAEAQQRLWTLALALDGALPEADASALDEARENMRRGLEEHALGKLSDGQLHQKLQALRDALHKRLEDMARQAMKQGALQNFDPKTQHLSSNAIDRAMSKLERALREGRMEDARQAMAQLNRMMDDLKNAHIMTPQEAQQAEQQAKAGRQQTGAVQDMVQRETGLLDHAQARAPHNPEMMPPFGETGRQDLQPPSGTEDPTQTPDMFPLGALGSSAPPQASPPGTSPPGTSSADKANPGASQPGSAQPDPQQSQLADARTQRALHRALDALKQGVAQSGHKAPPQLDEAGQAMMDAAGALARHDDPPARDAISRAIADLQQGGQAMSREQQGEGGSSGLQLSLAPGGQEQQGGGTDEGEDGFGDGRSGVRKDPFGRQVDGNGAVADDPELRVPDEMEKGRSRAIQDELRRRGADRGRSKSELDYIDRLLKPF